MEPEEAEVEAREIDHLDTDPATPAPEDHRDGVALIAGVIASLDGGHSGLNPYVQLGITDLGEGALSYTLTDRRTNSVQRFLVTVSPE